MPVTIPMAQPADLAGEYLRGVQTAAQIREAQQRLQVQQQETQQRVAQEQARLQQEHDVQQQRLAVTQAYQQQQVALRKQQLDQVAQVNAQKTASAARQFAARQQWQQGFAKIDADPNLSEEEKDKAKTSFTMRLAPMMGIPGTEAASMLRDMRPPKPVVPATVDTQSNPDFAIVHQPNGSVVMHPKPKAAAKSGEATVPQMKAMMDATDDDETKAALQKKINDKAFDTATGSTPMTNFPAWAKVPGGTPAEPPTSPARVRVLDPDGKPHTVPTENLEKFLAHGWKRVE